jgi:hypothetical protein
MNRRIPIAVATGYSLFVLLLLLTWPRWASPPQVDGQTVITATRSARWLLILIPFMWAWVAFRLNGKWRKRGLVGAVVLLVACFSFVWYHDNVLTYNPCLWHDGSCGGWFR